MGRPDIPETLMVGSSAVQLSTTDSARRKSLAARFIGYGGWIIRYGLIAPILWIGAAKFTAVEAMSIVPLITNQPLTGWMYQVLSVQAVSNMIGVIEVAAAILIALKPLLPRVSAVGSGIAIGLFLFTVSFLFTTPDVVDSRTSAIPILTDAGAFLIKDLVLLGAAVWTLGDALDASACRRHRA
jgi:reactive chlorine resistance protein C